MKKKFKLTQGLLVLLIFGGCAFFAGCSGSEQDSAAKAGGSEIISSTEKEDPKELAQGYWKSSSGEAPTLEINGSDVIVGVGWSQFWSGDTGVFENVANLEGNTISGTDSESGDSFSFTYEIKANRLIITFSEDWLPSVFEESDDTDDLTFESGQKFIYSKADKAKDTESSETEDSQ